MKCTRDLYGIWMYMEVLFDSTLAENVLTMNLFGIELKIKIKFSCTIYKMERKLNKN